jgi:hypothetical protein
MQYELNYKNKYKKYKNKFLNLKIQNQLGGVISSFKPLEIIKKGREYKHSNDDFCILIKDLKLLENEGRNNLGIGFITDEGKELFLKFGRDLWNDFVVAYCISTLKPVYPYFINVYGYTRCMKNEKQMDVLVTQKANETIYKYFCRNTYNYIKTIIPDYEDIVSRLDEIFDETMEEHNITYESDLETLDITKWDSEEQKLLKNNVRKSYEDKAMPIFEKLFGSYIKFKDFVSTFMKNLAVISNQYFLLDMITLCYLGDFVSDKKSDNFMITTKPYEEGSGKNIMVNLGDDKLKILNTITWDNTNYEHVYIFPVDFGSTDPENIISSILTSEKLTIKNISEIDPYIIKKFIFSNLHTYFYSDSKLKNNPDSLKQNIISKLVGPGNMSIRFSRNVNNFIIDKYNPFKFSFSDPVELLGEGINNGTINIEHLNTYNDIFNFIFLAKENASVPRRFTDGWTKGVSNTINTKYDIDYSDKYNLLIDLPIGE